MGKVVGFGQIWLADSAGTPKRYLLSQGIEETAGYEHRFAMSSFEPNESGGFVGNQFPPPSALVPLRTLYFITPRMNAIVSSNSPLSGRSTMLLSASDR